MAATIKDVAKQAGVSTATVSRVINNDKHIAPDTRERVLQIISDLNYTVNNVARSLKINRTHTVGLITPAIAEDFFMQVAQGAETVLRKEGYTPIICNSNEELEEEAARIRLLLEQQTDGVIIIPATNRGEHFDMLTANHIPYVLVDRVVDQTKADAVLVDNINGAYEATEYLITRGYRRFGFIGGDIEHQSNARERFVGFKRALEDYKIELEEDLLKYGDFHERSGYELIGSFLNNDRAPEVVFISNYYMYVGAVKYLIRNKDNMKQPVYLASFDDMAFSEVNGLPSLNIAQPIQEIGMEAARLLLSRIRGEELPYPQIRRLKTRLVHHNT